MYIVGKGLSTRKLDIIFCVNNCRDAMDKNRFDFLHLV